MNMMIWEKQKKVSLKRSLIKSGAKKDIPKSSLIIEDKLIIGEDNGGGEMFEYGVGDKVEVVESLFTVDGTLYKDEICTVDGVCFPDKDLRIKDNTGKLWYVNEYDIRRARK